MTLLSLQNGRAGGSYIDKGFYTVGLIYRTP